MSLLLLLATVDLVSGGEPRLRVETDGSPAARYAAELIKRHAILKTGVALPATGALPPLRIQLGGRPGYAIREAAEGILIEGRDPVRAAHDLLEAWGDERRDRLAIEPREWRPRRFLWIEAENFDASLPAAGLAVRGIEKIPTGVRELGYSLRVASESFDDFLPPALFAQHPEWFALRSGKREARGNFALTNAEARAAYLNALGTWLKKHPEVDVAGIWPEVTSVWCEETLALGAPEAYALLWREAAARFPGRGFEILATGLTLRPPADGGVPKNVEVRLRPGRDASGLQGLLGQKIDAVVKAWEVRGARVLLEIDAAPESWCGMPWPCHDAIRANAERFRFAVLRGGGRVHAQLWRDPDASGGDRTLLDRARRVVSWGDPRDAAELFFEERQGLAFKIGATERLLRLAVKEQDPQAANDVYLGYRSILRDLKPAHRRIYKRHRGRDVRRMMETLLPEGATRKVGPASVRETFARTIVETDTLRLEIDRDAATVISLKRRVKGEWCEELCEGAFEVVALKVPSARTDGDVELSSPATGKLRIDLRGRLRADGPRWRSRLDLASGSGIVRQVAEVVAAGGIAAGCIFPRDRFDRWVCPPHAREGRLGERAPTLPLPADALVYVRKGERGAGLAARLPHGGTVTLAGGLVATRSGRTLMVDWIVFVHPGELALR